MWTADELLAADFPPPRWAVPGLICEGLTLMAGPPKVGKSWLGLELSVAVAASRPAMDTIAVEGGESLYLALEDPPRRLQSRLGVLLGDTPAPRGLTLATEWARMHEGGHERLDAWLTDHPGARLVVVDVLAKVRNVPSRGASIYATDYAALQPFKELAERHRVAVVVLHHTNKGRPDDWLDSVSGTQGLSGAADALMVLTRSRGRADGELKLTGRDVDEAEHALSFDLAAGGWRLLGNAREWSMSPQRQQILNAVRDGDGLKPKAIAAATGIAYGTVKQLVRRMAAEGQLTTDGRGTYAAPPTVHPVHFENRPE